MPWAAAPEPLPEGEGWEESLLRLTGVDPMQYPGCGRGRLRLRRTTPRSFPLTGAQPPVSGPPTTAAPGIVAATRAG